MENSLCAEFGIRAEKCQEPTSRVRHDETWSSFSVIHWFVFGAGGVVALVYLLNGYDPKRSYRVTYDYMSAYLSHLLTSLTF